jgi:hypothetical protein
MEQRGEHVAIPTLIQQHQDSAMIGSNCDVIHHNAAAEEMKTLTVFRLLAAT